MANTIEWYDGFDLYGSDADMDADWPVNSASDYQAASGRFLGGCGRVRTNSTIFISTRRMEHPTQINATEFTFSCAALVNADNDGGTSFIRFSNLTDSGDPVYVEVVWTNSWNLQFKNGDGTVLGVSAGSLFQPDVWHWLEIYVKVHDTTGEIDCYLDGVQLLNLTGVDTSNGASGYVDTIGLHMAGNPLNSPSGFCETRWDDTVFQSHTGGTKNFFGDAKVVTRYPDATGTNSDFTATGAATTWQATNSGDAGPDDDTSYVGSSTAGHKSSLNTQALGEVPGTIFALQPRLWIRKEDAGARTFRPIVVSSAVQGNGSTQALTVNFQFLSSVFEVDPNTAVAWDLAGIDAAEIGLEIIA